MTSLELISLVDPTGLTNAILAVHYCWKGDTGNCAVNALAFIPLAGGVLKDVGKGAKIGVGALEQLGSSRLLAANLENAGFIRAEGEAAHHMVLANSPDAAAARAVLERFGIDVNAGANGVFLPGNLTKPNPLDKAVHSTIHTDAYIAEINETVVTFQSEAEVRDYLEYLRLLLQTGRPPGS